jgi:glutathione S-transferase
VITVWGRATSSNVQAVMWCIGELDLAYERLDRGHIHGGLDAPDFRAMNPHGRVPVIKDGDGPAIWEAGAILRYLATRYGAAGFWPDDPVRRAQIDMWADWAKISVTLKFTAPVFWAVVRTAKRDRDEAAFAQALCDLTDQLVIADARLGQVPFLSGEAFSIADIQLGHLLFRYFEIAIPRADLPALRRYYDRLIERPAFREHVMVSYETLRVEGAQ